MVKTEEELLRKRIVEINVQIELLEQKKEQLEYKLAQGRKGND